LIPGKVYRIVPDPRAAKDDFVRIIDESGEDYLYHRNHFVFVDFPKAIQKKLLRLEGTIYPVAGDNPSTRIPRIPGT
jgi:hypothetical protein